MTHRFMLALLTCAACLSFGFGPATASADEGQDDLPEAPAPPEAPDPYTPETEPAFGSDVAVGIAVGALLGSWPEPGVTGMLFARYDAFLADASQPGPRLGLSLWGSTAVWPLQDFLEDDGGRTGQIAMSQYGAMTVLRADPAAPVGGLAGLGLSRIDLRDYYEGPLAIPTVSFEGGARIRGGRLAFVDVMARAHWGTTRSPTAASWHEWWSVQLLLTPGLHAR